MLGTLAKLSADAADAYARLMEIGMEQKNWEQVAENGRRYLAVYPMLPATYWRLGRADEELGREEPAIDSYRRLLLLDPADPVDIHYRLAKLLQKRDPAGRQETCSRSARRRPAIPRGPSIAAEDGRRRNPDSSGDSLNDESATCHPVRPSLAVAATGTLAQRYYDRVHRGDVPDWELDKEFAQDVFTFVRIQYSSGYGGRGGGRRGYGGGFYGAAEAAGRPTTPTAT